MKSINPKLIKIESIRIGLASPEHIKKWAERTLPNGKTIGQVTSSQTVNYKTLKPEKGGLFCERVFGPVKDFECACGKKKTRPQQKYCSECDVEFTSSRIRRYRLGFIQLISPVAHVWYLKGRPSYISILLDIPRKKVEAITYSTEMVHGDSVVPLDRKPYYYSISSQHCSWEIQEDWNYFVYFMSASPEKGDRLQTPMFQTPITSVGEKDTDPSQSFGMKSYFSQTGAFAIRSLLSQLDLPVLDRELRSELFFINEQINEFENLENQGYVLFDHEQRQLQMLIYRRAKKLRRLKLVRHFRRTKARPEWMILSVLPVLPPDLRPIIQLDGDQVAVSDLNKLYQKVLFRNNRMKRHSLTNSDEMKYAQRLLQEAVDALIENGKGGSDPICASNDRPLKSLSDMLKGKKGRFRQNLLGKRVDYSGRSVIVVGPNLKIHQCGLPKEMAIELFQPFLIRRLMAQKIVRTIVGAKRLLQRQDTIIWEILDQVMQNHPVLLNRAPTLHRIGIQAFQPKLVEGRAILLHPLVCSAFNADFDGDQMAVHIPLSFQARAEAWTLMWSRNNLLSPATGQPILVPSQDMVLGCYYLTTSNPNQIVKPNQENHFSNITDVLKSFYLKKISIHTPIWLRWDHVSEDGTETENPIEIRVHVYGSTRKIYSQAHEIFDKHGMYQFQYLRTTPGRVVINQIIQEISD